ncbi:MAG: VWA domain-containing protein, partial [Firmicutes bacterium]|nr:VWA domain-containing protein [Bacillota bacterium]
NDRSSGWAVDSSLYNWLQNNADKSKIYYIVGADSSATVTAIYYGGKEVNSADSVSDSNWRYVDSAYLKVPDGVTKAGTLIKSSGSNDPSGHLLTGTIYTAEDSLRRMDYLKLAAKAASSVLYGVDPSSQVGLVTFAQDAYPENTAFYPNPNGGDNAFYNALTNVTLKGGTDQADGLIEGKNLFKDSGRTTQPIPKRVAILITDGAPNQSGRTDWDTVIGPAASDLKNLYGTDSIELYTLGLSMDMVGETNRLGLQSIATGGVSGDHWFEASKGSEIVAALEKIIESIINEASLKGNITDTIDPAFYLITKDGTPLAAGDMIDLNGEKITKKPSDGKYGVITESGGVFGVNWKDQLVGYSENGSSEWEGKF